MAWYETDKVELMQVSEFNWIWRFYTDGKKVFRWFGQEPSDDIFNVAHAGFGFCSGIQPDDFSFYTDGTGSTSTLYADDLVDSPISFGEWTKCEYPSYDWWLEGCEVSKCVILLESGKTIDAFMHDGKLCTKVWSKITPVSEIPDRKVRIVFPDDCYPVNYFGRD